jgi:hypothetical protein
MKNSLRYILPVLGLFAALPATRAADEPKPAEKTEKKKEMRVLAAPGGHGAIIRHLAGEMENVTFLGVETASVSPTLVAQLGLTEGSGLVVNHVVPDSPAAGVLKQHDILLKLDDQLLIEQRQLAVLVRNHKEGDEVTLTFLRGGKQTTAKVKLAKHEAPKMSVMPLPPGGVSGFAFGQGFPGDGGVGNFDVQVLPREAGPDGDHVNRVLSLIDGQPGTRRMSIRSATPGPGDRTVSVTVNTGNSHVVLDDDKGSLNLTIKDGQKELVAKNAKGEQIFSGPVNTPEERKTLPPDVRARLEKLEDSTQFRFKTDGDFKGAETRILRPRGQGISLPMEPAPAPRRAPLFL